VCEGSKVAARPALARPRQKRATIDCQVAESVSDQRRHWDALYARDPARRLIAEPSPLAVECGRLLVPGSLVLELGCGAGQDAACFARAGHTVCATDFSTVALAANRRRQAVPPNPHWVVLNTGKPLPFADATFDAVYARLSLHYFADAVTRRVFREIRRVLRPGGLLCFLCKSPDDPLYGRGRQLEPDMFELAGHVRHFFSAEYARACLGDAFQVVAAEAGRATFHEGPSAFVKVVARAI
jgi:SAM-dependent methyltransferase